MTHQQVLEHYTEAQQRHQQTLAELTTRRSRIFYGLTLSGVVIAWLALSPGHAGVWPILTGFLALFVLLGFLIEQAAHITRTQRLISFYDYSVARADGTTPQSGRTGLEPGQQLRTAAHLYDHDLDLLGEKSLFGLLATVRTGPGEQGLANYLLKPVPWEESVARQQAVKELLPQTELRERIALLGTSKFHQLPASAFTAWLDEPAPAFAQPYRIVLWLTALLNVVLLLTGASHIFSWAQVLPNLLLTLALQAAVSLRLRSRVKPILESSARLQQHVKLIIGGLALLQQSSFTSPKLNRLREQASQPAGAGKLLSRLSSSLEIVEQRPKEYFLLLSLLVAAGAQAAISIARWKRDYADSMRVWLDAWAEFEALNALATYAFEHPEDAWPTLLEPTHAPHFEAAALGHPLLPEAVTNEVALTGSSRFYLISGSNMAGKSTLLRSIGINAVLAYAGAPVRAASMSLSPLHLGAALALTDSLAEGKSKFLAEVQRLASVVHLAKLHPTLFLVDEIFSGTNSHDRRTAAYAVLSSLLASGAIGAMSTHDLALTDLATQENTGENVHMASPDPDDPLAFDYKLKPGINTSSNALAIIRLMGIE